MFTNSDCEEINLHSNWHHSKELNSTSTQTNEININTNSTQYPLSKCISTQTSSHNEKEKSSQFNEKKFDYEKVNKFLKRIIGIVQKEIEKSVHYYNSYNNNLLNYLDNYNDDFDFIALFSSKYFNNSIENYISYEISSFTWNCSSTSIALTYKVNEHSSWCTHQSYIYLWNILHQQSKTYKPTVIEYDCCISCIQSHPYLPSIFAVGTISGDILLINTRLTENERYIMSKTNSSDSHTDQVTAIHFLVNEKGVNLFDLLTVGFDGKIICWQFNEKKKQLIKLVDYEILISDLPKTMGIKSSAEKTAQVSILCLSVNKEDEAIFLLGCEGGAIFQCSLHRLNDKTEYENKLNCPIVLKYTPHRSNITQIQFKLNSRNIFLTVALDNELRIYNLHESNPFAVLHLQVNLISCSWQANENTMIIAIDEEGFILLIKFFNNKTIKLREKFLLNEKKKLKKLLSNFNENNEMIAFLFTNNELEIMSAVKKF